MLVACVVVALRILQHESSYSNADMVGATAAGAYSGRCVLGQEKHTRCQGPAPSLWLRVTAYVWFLHWQLCATQACSALQSGDSGTGAHIGFGFPS
jgi:hypothetical protein